MSNNNLHCGSPSCPLCNVGIANSKSTSVASNVQYLANLAADNLDKIASSYIDPKSTKYLIDVAKNGLSLTKIASSYVDPKIIEAGKKLYDMASEREEPIKVDMSKLIQNGMLKQKENKKKTFDREIEERLKKLIETKDDSDELLSDDEEEEKIKTKKRNKA